MSKNVARSSVTLWLGSVLQELFNLTQWRLTTRIVVVPHR